MAKFQRGSEALHPRYAARTASNSTTTDGSDG
jgi:hypothetical protein